jgi:hypothetical protein
VLIRRCILSGARLPRNFAGNQSTAVFVPRGPVSASKANLNHNLHLHLRHKLFFPHDTSPPDPSRTHTTTPASSRRKPSLREPYRRYRGSESAALDERSQGSATRLIPTPSRAATRKNLSSPLSLHSITELLLHRSHRVSAIDVSRLISHSPFVPSFHVHAHIVIPPKARDIRSRSSQSQLTSKPSQPASRTRRHPELHLDLFEQAASACRARIKIPLLDAN